LLNKKSNISGSSDETEAVSGESSRISFVRLLPIFLLIAGLTAFFVFDFDRYVSLASLKVNREALTEWVGQAGFWACLIYAGVYAAVTAFSIPAGAVMTITGGFLFGPVLGGSLTIMGATIGATGLFLAARYAFADILRKKAGASIQKMEQGFQENALSYLLFLRLIPVFPFFLVNLVPAFLGVRVGTYVIGTFLGIIPGSLVYASVGDGVGAVLEAGRDVNLGIIFEPRFLLPIVGLGILALLPILYKMVQVRRTPGTE
jgi:uncharacterized membrane protein YdjX (TVP38/TMEM64 family)